jgi:hypothetical protein
MADNDFFNEPSTMRPRFTAAAAYKEGETHHQDSINDFKVSYDMTARGAQTLHRAAAVA